MVARVALPSACLVVGLFRLIDPVSMSCICRSTASSAHEFTVLPGLSKLWAASSAAPLVLSCINPPGSSGPAFAAGYSPYPAHYRQALAL